MSQPFREDDSPSGDGEEPLYRLEALIAHRQGRRGSEGNRWLGPDADRHDSSRLPFYALLAVAAAALAVAMWVPIDDRVAGEAVVLLVPTSDASQATAEVGSGARVRVRVPAARRPQLAVGQPLHLRLDGFPETRLETRVSEIATSAEEEGGAGGMVIVEARLDEVTYTRDGHRLVLRDGLRGRAEVLVASRPLFGHLKPAGRDGKGAAS